MEKREIIVGSRASALALAQTNLVIEKIKKVYPDLNFKIKKIKTIGDKILDKTLNKIGGKGLFVKEIEAALLKKEIDMAVHSMKDVPSTFPEGLEIGAITEREDVRDVLVAKDSITLENLKIGARIGTSSLRRGSQILAKRNDVKIEPIRGNIQTRMNKIQDLNLDGVILAAAGIKRMGLEERISDYLSTDDFVPAVGQGALGIEIREDDKFMKEVVASINDKVSEYTIKAERSFMKVLNGGCHVPIGGYAFIEGEKLKMTGMVSPIDGSNPIKVKKESKIEDYERLGEEIAREILAKGGKEILMEIEGDM